MIEKLRNIFSVNITKTLWLNYVYFGLGGVQMPIIVRGKLSIKSSKGKINLSCPIKRGLIHIGDRLLGTNPKSTTTSWEVAGELEIKGRVCLGSGCKICIAKGAKLILGDNFAITGNSHIICRNHIEFGNDTLLSWDILVMDDDSHTIYEVDNNEIVNSPGIVEIGNHVWIGCRSLILKNTVIADNCIIGADSTIAKRLSDTNCIIAGKGSTLRILKRNINWRM